MTNDNGRKESHPLEERLARLVPASQSELADNIMAALDDAAPRIALKSEQKPRCSVSVRSPLLAGMLGIALGAAVMFILMSILQTPKVEVREIVREIVVSVPVAPEPEMKSVTTKDRAIITDTNTSVELSTSLFGLNFYMSPHPVSSGPPDLDRIIDEAMLRQHSVTTIRHRPIFRESVSKFSRAEYREMLRQTLESL